MAITVAFCDGSRRKPTVKESTQPVAGYSPDVFCVQCAMCSKKNNDDVKRRHIGTKKYRKVCTLFLSAHFRRPWSVQTCRFFKCADFVQIFEAPITIEQRMLRLLRAHQIRDHTNQHGDIIINAQLCPNDRL